MRRRRHVRRPGHRTAAVCDAGSLTVGTDPGGTVVTATSGTFPGSCRAEPTRPHQTSHNSPVAGYGMPARASERVKTPDLRARYDHSAPRSVAVGPGRADHAQAPVYDAWARAGSRAAVRPLLPIWPLGFSLVTASWSFRGHGSRCRGAQGLSGRSGRPRHGPAGRCGVGDDPRWASRRSPARVGHGEGADLPTWRSWPLVGNRHPGGTGGVAPVIDANIATGGMPGALGQTVPSVV